MTSWRKLKKKAGRRDRLVKSAYFLILQRDFRQKPEVIIMIDKQDTIHTYNFGKKHGFIEIIVEDHKGTEHIPCKLISWGRLKEAWDLRLAKSEIGYQKEQYLARKNGGIIYNKPKRSRKK